MGDLPQAVDSIGTAGSQGQGGAHSGTGGGRSAGGVAVSNTSGGAPGKAGSGTAGAVGSGGADSRDSGVGGGGPVETGGHPGSGGRAATGGSTASGGQIGTGGTQNTGGGSLGGAGGCTNPCDCDGDGATAISCGGTDCDDSDPLVYKDEPVYYATPSLHHGFDYDCNGNFDIDPKINKQQNCGALSLVDCNTATNGFLNPIGECGTTGDWGTCMTTSLLTCAAQKTGTMQVVCK